MTMSYKIKLTQEEVRELKSRMRQEKQSKIYRRLLALELKNGREKNGKIAQMLGVTLDTLTDWFKLFLEEGFKGLCSLNYSGRASKLDFYREELKEYLSKNSPSRIVDLQEYMRDNYSVNLSRWAYSNYLRNEMAYSYKKRD